MKCLKSAFVILNLLFILWFVLSWVNIVTHNLTDRVYWDWNLFTLVVDLYEAGYFSGI